MAKYNNYVSGKTENQKEYIRSIQGNKIVLCVGPAGTGKTFIASGMGITQLLSFKYDKLIITRPLVQAGENTGYLPGDIGQKLEPFLRPIMDEIGYFTDAKQIKQLVKDDKIEVLPFAFMRGRNFKDCFVIADETQNASYQQIKTLLTRVGSGCKMVITGDFTQSDLPRNEQGGLETWTKILTGVEGVGIVELTGQDIMREAVVSNIICAEDKYNEKQKHTRSKR